MCAAGKWQGESVAIKVLSSQGREAGGFEALSECLVSKRVHHPNLVRPNTPRMVPAPADLAVKKNALLKSHRIVLVHGLNP